MSTFVKTSNFTHWELAETHARISKAVEAVDTFITEVESLLTHQASWGEEHTVCDESIRMALQDDLCVVTEHFRRTFVELPGPPMLGEFRVHVPSPILGSFTGAKLLAGVAEAAPVGSPSEELSILFSVLAGAAIATTRQQGTNCFLSESERQVLMNSLRRAALMRIQTLYISHLDHPSEWGIANAARSPFPKRPLLVFHADMGFMRWEVISTLLTDLGRRKGQSIGEGSKRSGLRMVEVGVDEALMMTNLLQKDPLLQIIGVDPYEPYTKLGVTVGEEVSYKKAVTRLEAFDGRGTLMKMQSAAAAEWIAPGVLDLVFIDGSHSYESVLEDITHWAPKVRRGGVVAGHDYSAVWYGVVRAANEQIPPGCPLHLSADFVWWWEVP